MMYTRYMHSDPCEWHHTEPLTCSAMLQLPNKGREEEDCRHVNTDVKNAGFTGEHFQLLRVIVQLQNIDDAPTWLSPGK